MWGDSGRAERSAAQYLPYIGHIGPQTLLLESGALLAMAHVEGQAFELADHAARNARLRLLNTLYRNLADDNVTIHTHLVRHADLAAQARAPVPFWLCSGAGFRLPGQGAGGPAVPE